MSWVIDENGKQTRYFYMTTEEMNASFQAIQANCSKFGAILSIIFSNYPKIEKAWGQERVICNTPEYCAKLLIIKPRWRCSIHKHIKKSESFVVLGGEIGIETGINQREMKYMHADLGQKFDVNRGTWHRFENTSFEEDGILLEISTHHEDEDVVRHKESEPIL